MQSNIEVQPIHRRFVRRIVKKDPVDQDIKVVHIQQSGFMPILRRAAAGGGNGDPEPEPFCGAGGGGGGPEPFCGAGCRIDSEEEEELMYAKHRQQTPLEALHALKVKALATLDAARAIAGDAFMKAAIAKNGNDYNCYMDKSAVAGAEVQRLYNIVDDIEDRIMVLEFPGLFP